MGRPPLIDRDVVIKTALEIVDSEGLEALSMRRLAGALDVNVAALYGYFDNKQDVLRSVDAFIFSEMSFDDRSSDDWTEIVVRQALAFYRLMRRHPNAIPIFVQFPSKEVTSRPYGRFVELLISRDVPRDVIDAVAEAFETMVIGSATLEFSRRNPGEDVSGWDSPRRGATGGTAGSRKREQQFVFICRALVDGFAASIEKAKPTGPRY